MSSFRLKIAFQPLGTFTIAPGECWLVNTGGSMVSSSFFDWLETGKYIPESSIEYTAEGVTAREIHTAGRYLKTLRFRLSANEGDKFYYQQRYHATENDAIMTLRDYLGPVTDEYFIRLSEQMGLDRLLDEKINMLSTGEFRKSVTLKSAMAGPSVMFLDEPYAGLDAEGCRLFSQLFSRLAGNGTSLVLFTAAGHNLDL